MFSVYYPMKKIVCYLILLTSLICKSQINGSYTLIWNESSELKMGDITRNIPNFQPANFSFDDVRNEIFFVSKFPTNSPIDESSLVISNMMFENIDAAELKELNPKLIPSKIISTAFNIEAREDLFCSLKITPIIKDVFGYKRLISFSYSITAAASSRLKTANSTEAITNSALANGDFYRFYVEKSGVYRITKDFLRQLGLNTDGRNPQNISIFGNGGRMIPLSNSVAYPFDIAENAIQIIGEQDGVFNDQDFILMYCEGTDNWSAENQTHTNLYENRSYYYIKFQI